MIVALVVAACIATYLSIGIRLGTWAAIDVYKNAERWYHGDVDTFQAALILGLMAFLWPLFWPLWKAWLVVRSTVRKDDRERADH